MSDSAGGDPALQRRLLWGLLAAVMLAITVTAIMAPRWHRQDAAPNPEELGQVPEFAFVNRDGRTVSGHDLLGAPWVGDFIFTRCALSCPRMTSRMKQLGDLWPQGVDIARVSFSVDPDYDTPEVLQSYAESWEIDDPSWFFLTGDREQMRSMIMDGFKLAVEMDPAPGTYSPDEPILHSTRFVLVDARGQIRGYYDVAQGGELERLVRDLKTVAAE